MPVELPLGILNFPDLCKILKFTAILWNLLKFSEVHQTFLKFIKLLWISLNFPAVSGSILKFSKLSCISRNFLLQNFFVVLSETDFSDVRWAYLRFIRLSCSSLKFTILKFSYLPEVCWTSLEFAELLWMSLRFADIPWSSLNFFKNHCILREFNGLPRILVKFPNVWLAPLQLSEAC